MESRSVLATRIHLFLSLSRGGKLEQSWKERTAIKKHGWGGHPTPWLQYSDIVINDVVLEACQDAAALVECLSVLAGGAEKVYRPWLPL
jgi:hypothetical protein